MQAWNLPEHLQLVSVQSVTFARRILTFLFKSGTVTSKHVHQHI